MASILKIARAASPPPSEARAKLAEQIAEFEAAKEKLRGIRAALDGQEGSVSFNALFAADADVTAARERLEAAKKAACDYLVRNAIGPAEGPAPDLEAARAAVVAAEDKAAAIRGAREALGNELQPAKENVEKHENRLTDSVRDVIKDEGQPVILAAIEEIEALQKRLVAKHLALDCLLSESNTRTIGYNVQPGLSEVSSRAGYPLYQWRLAHVRGGNDPSPARTAWKAAVEALRTDPTAKLPEAV